MTLLDARDPVLHAVANWLAAHAPQGPLLVAVSGGADSLALAAAVIGEIPDRDPVAVTIDHGLQSGSADQALRCAGQLRGMGFRRVEIAPVTVGHSGGPEAAARTARYRVLTELASQQGDCPVLLGHTMDDQAETVLLGLARGSGPRSIAGMRPWRPPWGRPLLGVRRSDTEKACAAMGLVPWLDPHNVDPAFTRVRLRAGVLPLLDRVLGGGVTPALARTADLLADDLDALELAGERAVAATVGADGAIDCAKLTAEPAAVRRRAVRGWLAAQGISGLTADHLYRLDALLVAGPGTAVRLPGGGDVTTNGDRLRVSASS
ncbi:MAG: tRNA lysidine(34) synthetase TilS [Actinomycetota bacterium]|nr:tRNA lysidine(34) synthetase TilS [Actinomycetota bacterium]